MNSFKPWEQLHYMHKISESKHLSLRAYKMYSWLVWLAFDSGEMSELRVTNQRMCTVVDCATDDPMVGARNELIALGLMGYKRGRKGKPSCYSLYYAADIKEQSYLLKKNAPSLGGKKDPMVNAPQIKGGQSGVNTGGHLGGNEGANHPDLLREGEKREEKKTPAPTSQTTADGDYEELLKFYGSCSDQPPSDYDKMRLRGFVDEGYRKDEIWYAITQGADNNALKWPYIAKVLKNKRREIDEQLRAVPSGDEARWGAVAKNSNPEWAFGEDHWI